MKYLVLIFGAFILPVFVLGQDSGLVMESIHTEIWVKPATNVYITKVSAKGINKAGKQNTIDFPYTELEKIKTYSASIQQSDGSLKKLRKKDFTTRSLFSEAFYSGENARSFSLESNEKDQSFSYHYEKQSKEWRLLSFLELGEDYPILERSYRFHIPTGYALDYIIVGDTSLIGEIKVEKFKQEDGGFLLELVAKDVSARMDTRIVQAFERPAIHILLREENMDPAVSIAQWYQRKIKGNEILSPEIKKDIDDLLVGTKDTLEKLTRLFDWVEKEIKYIDFESGLGAIFPRPVQDVHRKMMGDCKDQSLLLMASLRYIGMEAWLGLTTTLEAGSDLSFVSLASANHMICMTQFKEKWCFLDPTERRTTIGSPSKFIQSKLVLVLKDEPVLVKAPIVVGELNKTKVSITYKELKKGFEGEGSFVINGFSSMPYESWKAEKGLAYTEENIFPAIEVLAPLEIKNTKALLAEGKSQIQTEIFLGMTSLENEGKRYLPSQLFPMPNNLYMREKEEWFHTFQAIDRTFTFRIRLAQKGKLLSPLKMEEEKLGMVFSYEIKQIKDQEIEVAYSYQNPYVEISGECYKAYFALNDIIQQTLAKPIVYEVLD